jgi:sirohydrochlorin cobaltochelatase
MDTVAQRMLQLDPEVSVKCAFLEYTEPTLATVVAELAASGAADVVIVPMFLGMGKHAREDVPQLVDALRKTHQHIRFVLKLSAGEEPAVIEFLARMAMSSL